MVLYPGLRAVSMLKLLPFIEAVWMPIPVTTVTVEVSSTVPLTLSSAVPVLLLSGGLVITRFGAV